MARCIFSKTAQEEPIKDGPRYSMPFHWDTDRDPDYNITFATS